jgi:hypothetical protein
MANQQQRDMGEQQQGGLNAAGSEEQQQAQAQERQQAAAQSGQRGDSGLPGGGVGRREGPFHTGVYPVSADEGAAGDAPLEGEQGWGQGERGAAGYEDSGDSGLDAIGEMEMEEQRRQSQSQSQDQDQDQWGQ